MPASREYAGFSGQQLSDVAEHTYPK